MRKAEASVSYAADAMQKRKRFLIVHSFISASTCTGNLAYSACRRCRRERNGYAFLRQRDIRITAGKIIRSPERRPHMKNGMFSSEADQFLRIGEKFFSDPALIPFDPADRIVLTVRIVIAILRIGKFVSAVNKRRSLGKQQIRHSIFHLFKTQM